MKQKTLIEGDVNLLQDREILVSEDEGYTVLREKDEKGEIKTSVIVPLEDFKKT